MAVETETPTHGAPGGGRAPAPGRHDAPRNSLWLAPAVLTVVPLAVLVALWLPARSWSARTGDARAGVTTLSSFSALAGTVLLATTIVLSARLRLLERRVGGLDRVYRLHHWLGGVAFTLVAVHPVLLAWRNATTSWNRAARVWWPTTGDWALAAGQLALYAMAVALTVTVFVRVRHQVLVWLQRILGAAFLVAAYHVLSVGGVVSTYRPLRWYMIGVLTAGTAALVYHSVLGRLLTRPHPYRVLAVVRRPGAVDELHLAPAGRPLHFVAGQFAFLRFRHGDISGEPHPFSMASAPGDGDLRFAVKELGDYTRHLHEVRPGADAVLEGPYGRFSYRFVAGHDQIWIAGGIGIAPFLSMAADLPRSGFEVELYYSFPDDDRAPFLDELAALEAANPTLHVHLSCDRRDGILTADAVAARSGSLDGREFLLCGPPAMMHALRSQLLARGVARQRVHFEEFRVRMKWLVGLTITLLAATMAATTAGDVLEDRSPAPQAPAVAATTTSPASASTGSASSIPGPSTDGATTAPTTPPATAAPSYTAADVAGHTTSDSCWLIISGHIYDVTTYLRSHPGGSRTITPWCGQESTEAFATEDGAGEHSDEAYAQLEDYRIGDLAR